MSAAQIAAIRALRQHQAAVRASYGGEDAAQSDKALAAARAKLDRREAESVVSDGSIFDGNFRYPEALERKRFGRTRDIVNRVVPGPDEDGSYLEMMARQAASIEMMLRGEHKDTPDMKMSDICNRVLLSTSPCFKANAAASQLGLYHSVQISAGLISFLFQMTKAVVLSWRYIRTSNGLQVQCTPDIVEQVLKESPSIETAFVQTVFNYMVKGLPRMPGLPVLNRDQEVPAQMLTAFNERFVLAHEYCHTLAREGEFRFGQGSNRTSEELFADGAGFQLLLESGDILDAVGPDMSAQGAFFVLATLEVLRQAESILRHGEITPDQGFGHYPPLAQRCAHLVKLGRDMGMTDEMLEGAEMPAQGLQMLWARSRKVFESLANNVGLEPHPIWS